MELLEKYSVTLPHSGSLVCEKFKESSCFKLGPIKTSLTSIAKKDNKKYYNPFSKLEIVTTTDKSVWEELIDLTLFQIQHYLSFEKYRTYTYNIWSVINPFCIECEIFFSS